MRVSCHIYTCIATNDDELEAELLALTGGKKGSGKKSKGSEASLSFADIDKMVASVKDIGEGDEDEGSLSDIDDDELLAELQVRQYCMTTPMCTNTCKYTL